MAAYKYIFFTLAFQIFKNFTLLFLVETFSSGRVEN